MEANFYVKLLEQVRQDYPELRFREGRKFAFAPPRTITVIVKKCNRNRNGHETGKEQVYSEAEQKIYSLRLLHELGHVTLGHRDFFTDVERLKMERAAWEKAREFCVQYEVDFNEDFVESELDTYRDWLHQRSKCRTCGQTRFQNENGRYYCPFCEQNASGQTDNSLI